MPAPKCAVKGCRSSSSKKAHKHISFHRFKKDTKEKWLQILGKHIEEREDYTNHTKLYICSLHFMPEDFEITHNSSYRLLKTNATPSRRLIMQPDQTDSPLVEEDTLRSKIMKTDLVPYKFVLQSASAAKKALTSVECVQPTESDTDNGITTEMAKKVIGHIRSIHSYSHSPLYINKYFHQQKLVFRRLIQKQKYLKKSIRSLKEKIKNN